MLGRATGAVLTGVEAVVVSVEADIASGLPMFNVVGLPDASVQEARDRIRPAITHLGEVFPLQRVTVNLAPSDVPKHGPGLDLAMALCLLAANQRLPQPGLQGRLILGELGLAGTVRPVRGALAAAEAGRAHGMRQVICPVENAAEASLAGLEVVGVRTLAEAVACVKGYGPAPVTGDAAVLLADVDSGGSDLAIVRDQGAAKRALEVAACGGHNVLMSGPPGTGKTMLARALPSIMPAMTVDEALEVTRIHSAAGALPTGQALIVTRPFQAPHHGVSVVGLVGGGSGFIRPGCITLAHRGLLFLDEFPEFPRQALEALRQPMEDGVISIVRGRHAASYPARFMLVAAMNPCPCGHAGSTTPCRCTPRSLEIYRQRISGPLLDRIDLQLHVPRVETQRLLDAAATGEPSGLIRKRVEAARLLARERGVMCNAELRPANLLAACQLSRSSAKLLSRASHRYQLSARSIHRLLRVARTIGDLEGAEAVNDDHVLEALGYRVAERRTIEDVCEAGA